MTVTTTSQSNFNSSSSQPLGQVIPDNFGKDGKGGRPVVKSTTAQQDVSIKNPTPPKVEMRDKDSREYGLKEANGLVSKFMNQMSISPLEVPQLNQGIQQLTDYIKKLDPQNTSGAVQPALDVLDRILKQGINSPLQSIPGFMGSGLMSQLQSFITQLVQQNKQANQNQQQTTPTCPSGMTWNASLQMCVLNPTS